MPHGLGWITTGSRGINGQDQTRRGDVLGECRSGSAEAGMTLADVIHTHLTSCGGTLVLRRLPDAKSVIGPVQRFQVCSVCPTPQTRTFDSIESLPRMQFADALLLAVQQLTSQKTQTRKE